MSQTLKNEKTFSQMLKELKSASEKQRLDKLLSVLEMAEKDPFMIMNDALPKDKDSCEIDKPSRVRGAAPDNYKAGKTINVWIRREAEQTTSKDKLYRIAVSQEGVEVNEKTAKDYFTEYYNIDHPAPVKPKLSFFEKISNFFTGLFSGGKKCHKKLEPYMRQKEVHENNIRKAMQNAEYTLEEDEKIDERLLDDAVADYYAETGKIDEEEALTQRIEKEKAEEDRVVDAPMQDEPTTNTSMSRQERVNDRLGKRAELLRTKEQYADMEINMEMVINNYLQYINDESYKKKDVAMQDLMDQVSKLPDHRLALLCQKVDETSGGIEKIYDNMATFVEEVKAADVSKYSHYKSNLYQKKLDAVKQKKAMKPTEIKIEQVETKGEQVIANI